MSSQRVCHLGLGRGSLILIIQENSDNNPKKPKEEDARDDDSVSWLELDLWRTIFFDIAKDQYAHSHQYSEDVLMVTIA